MSKVDPFAVDWSEEQTAVMQHLRDWAVTFAELNQHLASWMSLPGSDANALSQIIWAAEEGEPLSPADLSRRIGMTTGSTAVLLNRLEAAGHISRSREHADRRRVTLRPEAGARERAHGFFAVAGTEVAEVVLATPSEDLRQMVAFLERITAASVQANSRFHTSKEAHQPSRT